MKKYNNIADKLVKSSIANPERIYNYLLYISAAFFSVLIIFPFYFLFVVSITPQHGLAEVRYLPTGFQWENYIDTLEIVPLHQYILNSIIIATITTVFVLIVASLAGYVFGRFKFKGRGVLLVAFLIITYFPGTTYIIPLFRLFTGNISLFGLATPDLYGTPWPVVLPLAGITLPLATFILTVFYSRIPDGLEDAARIEGCTRIGALFRVIVPLSAPAVATVGILTFILVYNEFFFSFLLTDSSYNNWAPLVHGIQMYEVTTVRGSPYHLMAAGSILGLIPVTVLVFLGQKKIVSGLTAGALKE
ncbi:carbohydrate ABC transporter permease [Halobacteria archaeon AArc-curdl1]|uniref:Carbohydrate ABC transporter permease n=1 Tax=Natronosalvus hydrolyticus TaxID=2979988 RepID=A0AAP2ZAT2_9EURY|nr:carbohydrate ABC transporter permease [Halobacteria archaeon AArc-curdl1]